MVSLHNPYHRTRSTLLGSYKSASLRQNLLENRSVYNVVLPKQCSTLGTFATNATGKLDVFGHDGHTLGVDGTQVRVLEQTNEIGLRSFLKSQDSRRLETKIRLEVLGNLTDKALEGSLSDEEISALLILADLTKSYSSRAVSVRLLDSSRSGS
jgi:hypothetical protein